MKFQGFAVVSHVCNFAMILLTFYYRHKKLCKANCVIHLNFSQKYEISFYRFSFFPKF